MLKPKDYQEYLAGARAFPIPKPIRTPIPVEQVNVPIEHVIKEERKRRELPERPSLRIEEPIYPYNNQR